MTKIRRGHIAAARAEVEIANRRGRTVPDKVAKLAALDINDPRFSVNENPVIGTTQLAGIYRSPDAPLDERRTGHVYLEFHRDRTVTWRFEERP